MSEKPEWADAIVPEIPYEGSPLHRRKLSRTRESDLTNSPFPVVTKTIMSDALKWEGQPDEQANPLVKNLVLAKTYLGNTKMRLSGALRIAEQTDPENFQLKQAIASQLASIENLIATFPLVVKE